MILLAHQLGHTVVEGMGPPAVFVSDGTHTRQVYSHRRQRRPMPYLMAAVLAWILR